MELLDGHERTLWRQLRAGELRGRKVGCSWVVTREALVEFLLGDGKADHGTL